MQEKMCHCPFFHHPLVMIIHVYTQYSYSALSPASLWRSCRFHPPPIFTPHPSFSSHTSPMLSQQAGIWTCCWWCMLEMHVLLCSSTVAQGMVSGQFGLPTAALVHGSKPPSWSPPAPSMQMLRSASSWLLLWDMTALSTIPVAQQGKVCSNALGCWGHSSSHLTPTL